MYVGLVTLLLILLVLSAFFSAADMAFSCANKIRLKRFVEEGRPGAASAMALEKDFNRTISTILIAGNMVDILNTSILTTVLAAAFGPIGAIYAMVLMTVLLILFGEILPKAFVKDCAEPFMLASAPVLKASMVVLRPLVWASTAVTQWLRRFKRDSQGNETPSVTHDELLSIVEDMGSQGVLPHAERELIESAINFNELEVWEVQTPRIDIFALNVNENPETAKNLILKNHYTRVPVYDGTTDNIIGILNEKLYLERLVNGQPADLRSCLLKPLLVSGSTSLMDAFRILKTNRTHMAVVLDDYGGTSGIVTLEDLMEELLGEIFDELDDIKENFTQIEDRVYLTFGDVYMEDLFFKYLHCMEMPDTDMPTLSGWLIEEFKVFPDEGARFQWRNFCFEIVKVGGQRIQKVRITEAAQES